GGWVVCRVCGGESAGDVAQRVAGGCGAAGGGGGGGEAAGGGVREQRWRAGSAAGVGQGGCLVAAAEEAGAGARARLGQREGDGDALDRLPARVQHTCPQRPRVAGAARCLLRRVRGGVGRAACGGRGEAPGGAAR